MDTRILLLGNGRWGSNILKAANTLPGVEVVPVLNVREGWRSALNTKKYDAVAVATPPESHAELAIHAINLGKPVFIEKPFTADLWSTFHLSRYATSKCASVFVDHTYLFHESWNRLRAAIASRPVKRVATFGGNLGPFREGATMLSTLWDWAPHDLSMLLDLCDVRFPRVVRADADRHGQGWIFKVELQVGETSALLQFGNGFPERIRRVEVELEDGTQLRFNGSDAVSIPPLTRALQVFTNGVRTDFRPQPPWGTALAVSVARAISETADLLREH